MKLSAQTILIAPSAPRQVVDGLERRGARVITWPEIQISDPESFTALDEAVDNLFGYDWLLFRHAQAAEFFLRRFQLLAHEISELDSLRVCAIGEASVRKLETAQVHIDVIPGSTEPEIIVDAIGNYAGGREALERLNFLIPRASAARDGLCERLEEAGARVDVITAYRPLVPRGESLAHINGLIAGGGVDCVVFTATDDPGAFALLLDANNLRGLLQGVAVACLGDDTLTRAIEYGLAPDICTGDPRALADLVASYLSH